MQRARDEQSRNYERRKVIRKQKNRAFFLNEDGRLPEPQDAMQIRERFRKYAADANSNNGMVKKTAQEGACRDLEFFVMNIISRKFSTYTEKDQPLFEDLVQAGRLGIILSLPRYDPEKSAPTTYFYTAILHEMAALVNSMKLDTKSYMAALKRKIKEVDREFAKYGRTPALHDYAYSIGISLNRIRDALAQMEGGKVMASIDDPDNASLIDKMASTYEPEEIVASKMETDRIIRLARELEPNEAVVRWFIEAGTGMADTDQLAKKYHRSPSEVAEGIRSLKNLLKNHEDMRGLYSEYFQVKGSGTSDRFCAYSG